MECTSGSNVGCKPSLCSNKLPGTEVKTETCSMEAMCWAPPFIECYELKLQTQELLQLEGQHMRTDQNSPLGIEEWCSCCPVGEQQAVSIIPSRGCAVNTLNGESAATCSLRCVAGTNVRCLPLAFRLQALCV